MKPAVREKLLSLFTNLSDNAVISSYLYECVFVMAKFVRYQQKSI